MATGPVLFLSDWSVRP